LVAEVDVGVAGEDDLGAGCDHEGERREDLEDGLEEPAEDLEVPVVEELLGFDPEIEVDHDPPR